MPNTNRDQTVYVQTGNPDTWSSAALQRPGELGKAFDWNDRAYQRVKLDSGATAANTVGVVAANQLAFWKDKAQYIVTNDKAQALVGGVANSFANNVAGIFRSAVPAGYYCDILIRGRNIPVAVAAADEVNVTGGVSVIADVTASTASVDGVAVGTATTYQKLGIATVASTSNVAYADIDIGNVP